MSSQLGAFTFINEGSTKRKEILAKFLDLEIFDKKFKTAKDDVADIKSAIRNLETVNYDEEIKKCKDDLIANEASTMKRKNSCKSIKKEIDKVQEEILGLDKKISSAPSEIIDIVDIRNKINKCEQDLLKNEKEVKTKEEQIQANNNKIIKANSFIQSFDKDSLEKKKQQHDEMQSELDIVLGLFENNYSKLTNIKKMKWLSDEEKNTIIGRITPSLDLAAPEECPRCESIITGLRIRISNLNILNIDTELSKFDNLISLKEGLEKSIPTDNLLLENLKSKISISKLELKELKESEKYYEDNKEVIEDLENIMNSLEAKKQLVSNRKKELEECETNLLDLYKSHGYYEQKLENLNTEKQKLSNLQTDYEAHDLYMRCMHPNGIAYDIIKKSLPTINSEIAKVLANVVDFNVFFETDDKRLDIYIQHPNLDPSPLEMASGAEKTVAAMAIRLAFTNISSLPKSQLFILDEPGTALDADRMEGFVRILEIVTSSFKNVILISHLESLKESAESIITIEKKNGYANVWA
jgi:DNA repair exonuclease SbcCD ATPase subunit